MDHATVVVATAGLATVLATAIALLSYHVLRRRDRRQIEALLERLGALEGQLVNGDGLEERRCDEAEPSEVASAPQPPTPGEAPSADVLAGRTSYVRRVVEGEGIDQTLAGQAIAVVHRHLAETLSPAEMAEKLHISLRTLERGLAADLACTPTQLIVAMKMREARRLLLTERFRVNEVATRLGFSSPYHFSRRFKEFYRVAPSDLARSRNVA